MVQKIKDDCNPMLQAQSSFREAEAGGICIQGMFAGAPSPVGCAWKNVASQDSAKYSQAEPGNPAPKILVQPLIEDRMMNKPISDQGLSTFDMDFHALRSILASPLHGAEGN